MNKNLFLIISIFICIALSAQESQWSISGEVRDS